MDSKLTDLKKLAALSAAATKGPWTHSNSNALHAWLVYPPGKRLLVPDGSLGPREPQNYQLEETEENAALIAAMRNSIDALVAECRAAREWLKADEKAWLRDPTDDDYFEVTEAALDSRKAYCKLVAGEGT